MTEFEKISHLIRFGLSFRKMTLESVTKWANEKLSEQTNDSLFFDLSRAGTTNKIIELLHQRINWNYNDNEIRSLILSYYNEYLSSNRNNWPDIEKELLEYFQLLEYDNSNDSVKDFLYYLSDDWHLRNQGFSGLLTMPEYLTENLIGYKDYSKLRELMAYHGLTGYFLP